MIKFFRRIRQNLLTENRLGKYLLYAIGEIVLVVIGILIALQINNWRENLRNYEGETMALIELKNEFSSNYQSFLAVLDRKKKAQQELYEYLNLLSDNSKTSAQKAEIERGNLAIISWDSGNAVLNSLLSTGDIKYIKNDSLKYLLHDWNRVLYSFDEHAIKYKDVVYELIDYEKLRLPIRMVKNGKWSYLKQYDLNLREYRESFIDDFRYQNLLINCVNGLETQIVAGGDLKKQFDQIRYLLDKEIQGR